MDKKKKVPLEILRTFRQMKEAKLRPKITPEKRLRAAYSQLHLAGYKSSPDLSTMMRFITDGVVSDHFLDVTSRGHRNERWVATSSLKIASGWTPEEAVARLLIAFLRDPNYAKLAK